MRVLQLGFAKFWLALASSAWFVAGHAFAINEFVQKLVEWETNSNAISQRSSAEFQLEHFEIPADKVAFDVAATERLVISKVFFVRKNGQQYVRWIINPEDTKWAAEVEAWLVKRKIPHTRERHFRAWYTASRSMIIEDPATGRVYSAKVSTNQTGGQWRDKKQDIADAEQVRLVSDYVETLQKSVGFQHFKFLPEPAAFYLGAVEQAMLVRSLGDAGEGKSYFLPGFSALHEKTGVEIAKANGARDVVKFWNENYNKPLARALAELAVVTGLTFDSPHSQNFLIELDSKLKPTGKIILRDFGDSFALRQHFHNIGYPEFLDLWEKGNIRKDLNVSVGLLHGNKPPAWLDSADYNNFGRDFFKEFEATVGKLTESDTAAMSKVFMSTQHFSYMSKLYDEPPTFAAMQRLIRERVSSESSESSGPGFQRTNCTLLGARGAILVNQ